LRVKLASVVDNSMNFPQSADARVFLLSPANAGGVRARLLFNPEARFELAVRLRDSGAPIGEVFAFISGLYFRGKLAYAEAFGADSLVITASRGLVPPHSVVNLEDLREIASVPIEAADPRYRGPLDRDTRALAERCSPGTSVVLLGSVATPKYIEPLLEVFGDRLLFPSEFVGRGDMSRGGLMLRAARARTELDYIPVSRAVRRGPRPPKLPRVR
jgi:hypothetical protein